MKMLKALNYMKMFLLHLLINLKTLLFLNQKKIQIKVMKLDLKQAMSLYNCKHCMPKE